MRADVSPRTIRMTFALAIVGLVTSGCLSGGGDDESTDTTPPITTPPPSGNTAPTISGNPITEVLIDNAYSFQPSASDADGDTLTFSIQNQPGWATFDNSTGILSGQPTLADVGVYENIRISVNDGTATTSLSAFSISVDQVGVFSATLSWSAPQLNEDGTALTDLAGYKIYWGTTSGSYPNSVTIEDTSMTTYVVDNLSAGTYEFVATAFNASGVESRYSSPATKVLQ
jgi:hypothetical protein